MIGYFTRGGVSSPEHDNPPLQVQSTPRNEHSVWLFCRETPLKRRNCGRLAGSAGSFVHVPGREPTPRSRARCAFPHSVKPLRLRVVLGEELQQVLGCRCRLGHRVVQVGDLIIIMKPGNSGRLSGIAFSHSRAELSKSRNEEFPQPRKHKTASLSAAISFQGLCVSLSWLNGVEERNLVFFSQDKIKW